MRRSIIPNSSMFKHSVQDDKEFTHADSKGHFLSFARGKETLVETPNDGVVPCGYRRGGISRGGVPQSGINYFYPSVFQAYGENFYPMVMSI